MIVDRVKASIKLSREDGTGGWRTLELGAEGTILGEAGETLSAGVDALYAELLTKVAELWPHVPAPSNGRSQPASVPARTPAHAAVPAPTPTYQQDPVATPPLPPPGPEYAPARPACPTPGCTGTRGPRSSGGYFDLCWNCSNEARNDAKGFARERAPF